jgi:hypothetical protein
MTISSSSSPVGSQVIASPFGLSPANRGAQMEGSRDGSTPAPPTEIDVKVGDMVTKESNPKYAKWLTTDQ